ncbi:MAG: DUF4870 domain-containing protein [Myxococcota bacterium]|nr:DUF4870 domain-containing protein [Myxococcota bacterium]
MSEQSGWGSPPGGAPGWGAGGGPQGQQPAGGWGAGPVAQGQPGGWGAPQGAPPQGVAVAGPSADGWYAQAAAAAGPATDDDKQTAFLAHLFAAGLQLVTCGMLAPAGPFLAYAMDKRRHPFALFHVNQAIVFHGVLLATNIALAVVFSILAFVTCGIGSLLYVLNGLVPLVGVVFGLIVGLKAKDGHWDGYPVVGSKVLAARSPLIK